MTDNQFDILDELYFLLPYRALKNRLRFSDQELENELSVLIEKGWLRCYINPNDEIEYDCDRFQMDYQNYYYLASKEGLLAHNSNF